MDNIILYSTHCPKCNILASKLKAKNIDYIENNDVEEMKKLGMQSAPYLSVNGDLLDFAKANKWINFKDANDFDCASCSL